MEDSYLPEFEDMSTIQQAKRMPGYTFKMHIDSQKIFGFTDGIDALQQTIFHILSVERYRYNIYSYDYGVELENLIGQSPDYVMTELKRRITDALLQDDRIDNIDGWTFTRSGEKMTVSFTVHSVYGDLEITKELVI